MEILILLDYRCEECHVLWVWFSRRLHHKLQAVQRPCQEHAEPSSSSPRSSSHLLGHLNLVSSTEPLTAGSSDPRSSLFTRCKRAKWEFCRHHLVRLPWTAGRAGSASLHCPRNEAFSFFKGTIV